MEDALDIGLGIPPFTEQTVEFLQVSDALHVVGHLLSSVSAIQIRADADVARVARDLTNVINVVTDALDPEVEVAGLGAVMDPAGDHHDGVEGHSDDGAALDEGLDLVVGELAVPVGEGAAVVVAGPDVAREPFEGVPEAFVAEVSGVQDDAKAFHFLEEVAASGVEGAGVVGAIGVAARAVVGGADGAQPVTVSPFEMLEGDQ